MLNRKDINNRYYRKHKEELIERRKEKELQSWKDELDSLSFVEINPYFNRLNSTESEKRSKLIRRAFELRYNIEHYESRGKGYKKEMNQAFEKYRFHWNLIHRLEYYRVFRNSYLKKHGKEPNLTLMIINDNVIPPEVNPKSEFYNESLLVHLEPQEGDREVEIREISDLTSDDEE